MPANDNEHSGLREGIFIMIGSSIIAWTVIIAILKYSGVMCCFW